AVSTMHKYREQPDRRKTRSNFGLAMWTRRLYLSSSSPVNRRFSTHDTPELGPRSPFEYRLRRRRAGVATLLLSFVLLFLGAAFFRTQVIKNHDFVLRAEDNRMRAVAVPAPRGAVFDRNGEVIAETVTSHALYLHPA